MQTVTVYCHLTVDPERLWQEIRKTRLLLYVARPVLVIRPVAQPRLPKNWEEGDYLVALWLGGIIPLGRQTIAISWPKQYDGTRAVRDNGHGTFVRQWDHTITIRAEGKGAKYTDTVRLDAGLATPLVTLFARFFYRHRQKRLRHLVPDGFSYR